MRQRENLLDTIGLLLRHRRLLLGVVAAATALAVLIALVLPEYFRAETTFLAVSPDQTNVSKIFNGNSELEVYGTGNDIERTLAVANSESTLEFLVDSFGLYEVYDVDPDGAKARFKVLEALGDAYEVTRTRYDEIEIAVEDKEPTRAAAMANAARERVRDVLLGLTASSREGLGGAFRSALTSKEAKLQSLSDTLRSLSTRFGIVDVEAQGEQLAEQVGYIQRQIVSDSAKLATLQRIGVSGRLRDTVRVLTARIAANSSVRESITDQLNTFALASTRLNGIKNEIDYLADQMTYDRERIRQVDVLEGQEGGVIIVLDEARVPDAKVRPVRWLIVVGAAFAAFALTALGIVAYESYKDVEWKRYLAA